MSHPHVVRVDPGTAKYARELTTRIQKSAEGLHGLLLEAFESECWRHLSYRSWTAYIDGEFDFTRQRAYQLVNQAKVLRNLTTAVDSSDEIHITEREARDIAPLVGEVIERTRAGVSVDEAVREVRQGITRVGHEPVVFADEEASDEHVHECRICGVEWSSK